MANYGFIIDNRKCIGCHACTVACKAEHEVPVGVNRTWVKYIEKGEFPNSQRLFSVMRCNHCDRAPCVSICPVTALYTRDDGIVDFDPRRCIGCKACMQACPYDALYIDPDTSAAAKCNYCAQRVDMNLNPACVNVCPTQAIIAGDLDNPNSQIAQLKAREPVTVRKPEKGTRPSLFYIDGDDSSLDPAATQVNSKTMWGEQSAGVGHFARLKPQADFVSTRSGNNDLSETLQKFLNLGEPDNVYRPPHADEKYNRAAAKLEQELKSGRRSYDAPTQGVLWGWQVTAYLWTKAIAAGVVMIPMLAVALGIPAIPPLALWSSIVVSLLFLGLTGLLLVGDLDQPGRFLNVMLRPQWRSWLVRGAFIITAHALMLVAWCVCQLVSEAAAKVAAAPLLLLSVLVAIYTAFLFAQAKGRDFWQNPLLSFHMFAHALMAGAAVHALLLPWGPAVFVAWIQGAMLLGIIMKLACDMFELTTAHPTQDAQRAARSIFHGRYANWYWGGVFVLGTISPLVITWLLPVGWMPLAGILALIGIYISEHLWVRAPQHIPLA